MNGIEHVQIEQALLLRLLHDAHKFFVRAGSRSQQLAHPDPQLVPIVLI
jgi:hypothetical protein